MADLSRHLGPLTQAIEEVFEAYLAPERRVALRDFAAETAALIIEAAEAGRHDLTLSIEGDMRMRLASEKILLHDIKWDSISGASRALVFVSARLLLGLARD